MSTKLATGKSAPVQEGGKARNDGHLVTIEDAAHSLKQGIVLSLSGLTEIETDIATLVRKTVSDALRTGGAGAGDLVNVVHHIVMGTIGAVEQVGAGLTMSVKSVAKGIIMGVHDVGGDLIEASSETLRSVIKHAAVLGSDVGTVAKRAMDGVIEATVDIGGDVAQVGESAIEGAIEEAGKVGKMAVRTVKDVLGAAPSGTNEHHQKIRPSSTKPSQGAAQGKSH